MDKTVRTEIRLPKKLRDKTKKEAKKLNLTYSAYVTMILTKFG